MSLNEAIANDNCPVCSTPYLTPTQIRKIKRVDRAIAVFNFLFGWAFGSEEAPRGDVVTYGMHVNQGRTRFWRRG